MRIGPSQQQTLSSIYYNLDSLDYIEKYSKAAVPYSDSVQHPFTSLISSKNEIEAALFEMDKLYNSNFLEFIRDQNACEKIGPHLSMMCREYPMHNIILVVEFITSGWTMLNISKLLTTLTYDWYPDFSGKFMNLYTKSSTEQDKLRISVFLLYGEDSETVALYLKNYMFNWSIMQQSSFIQFLEQCLSWDTDFFDEFLFYFLCHLQNKVRQAGFSKVVELYKLSTLSASKRLEKLFKDPIYTESRLVETSDELVAVDIHIYLTICIHKSYTTFTVDENDINEQQRAKAIAWIGKQPTLVSVESLVIEEVDLTAVEDTDSCVELEQRSFFRQMLDRLHL